MKTVLSRTIALMLVLLFISMGGLAYTFFGGEKAVSVIPKTADVEIECDSASYVTTFIVNADRKQGYFAIVFIPVTRSVNGIDCDLIEIFSNEFDLKGAYITDWNGFTNRRPAENVNHKFTSKSEDSISFDIDELNTLRAFGLVIPTTDIIEYTDAGIWTSALNFSTTYVNMQPPEVITENELSVFIDDALVLAEMNPPLSRREISNFTEGQNFSALLDKTVQHPLVIQDGTHQYVEDKNVQNVVTGRQLFLRLGDPEHQSTRDVFLLIFSTLFGVAIGGLIEAFLAMSLRPTVSGRERAVDDMPQQTNEQSSAYES